MRWSPSGPRAPSEGHANDSGATSVYVHFPWCAHRCPYCDFATEAIAPESIPHEAYADALIRELHRHAELWAQRPLVSIFVGGGTPSLWQPKALGRVLAAVRELFAAPPSANGHLEVTVECNPTSLDERKVAGLRAVGVNRLSLGVQSLRSDELSFLGRQHDANGALAAVQAACKGMPRVSADVMFGGKARPAGELARELEALVALGVSHLSCYALTIEPHTPFGALQRAGKLPLASEDGYCAAYLEAEATLTSAGFVHYEVSNYGLPGQACEHNLHYWRGGDYAGFGAGAVGCIGHGVGQAVRRRTVGTGAQYVAGRSRVHREPLDAATLTQEAWMLGLRTTAGLAADTTERRIGHDPCEGREAALDRHLARGNLEHNDRHWRVPQHRWLNLDSIISDLF